MAGLASGDALADARAIYPALATAPATPAADRACLRQLARWLGRYGIARNAYGFIRPAAGGYPVRHYGLWVDISGVAHLYGGETGLLTDLSRRLLHFELTAHVGLADTLGAGHALAWHGGQRTLDQRTAPPGAALEAISSLPVEGLRIDRACTQLLSRLGLKTIGSLAAVPRLSIERRFRSRHDGQRVLLRLDQTLGTVSEPRRPMVEPPASSIEALFPDPLVSSDGLIAQTGRLTEQLCQDFKARNLGARALRLTLHRSDGTFAEVTIGTSHPSAEPPHLMRLFGEKLSSLDLGFGADMLVLEATRAEPLIHAQQSLTAPAGHDPSNATISGSAAISGAQLIDRLANRLGTGAVTRLTAVASHWPERASIASTALHRPAIGCGRPGIGQISKTAPPSGLAAARLSGPVPWRIPGRASRPALLLERPEPIAVTAAVPDGPPVQFMWRRVTHRIATAAGPERIEAEWWRAIGVDDRTQRSFRTRDYYRLQVTTGGRFWVYRTRDDAIGNHNSHQDGDRNSHEKRFAADECSHTGRHDTAEQISAWFVHGLAA